MVKFKIRSQHIALPNGSTIDVLFSIIRERFCIVDENKTSRYFCELSLLIYQGQFRTFFEEYVKFEYCPILAIVGGGCYCIKPLPLFGNRLL